MPAFTLRLLTEADLPAYKALRDHGLRHDPSAFTSDFETAAAQPASRYAQRLGQPPQDHFILGAFGPGGALLGAVVCERDARVKKRHEAALVGMLVAPPARGQGVGRALLAEFDRLARQLPGLQQVVLSVTASNTHALALYQHAGFVRYGLQPRALCVDGRYHDKALMIRMLHNS
jgi:ribosomal protein S18 acetylase RimI-like enzyme